MTSLCSFAQKFTWCKYVRYPASECKPIEGHYVACAHQVQLRNIFLRTLCTYSLLLILNHTTLKPFSMAYLHNLSLNSETPLVNFWTTWVREIWMTRWCNIFPNVFIHRRTSTVINTIIFVWQLTLLKQNGDNMFLLGHKRQMYNTHTSKLDSSTWKMIRDEVCHLKIPNLKLTNLEHMLKYNPTKVMPL